MPDVMTYQVCTRLNNYEVTSTCLEYLAHFAATLEK